MKSLLHVPANATDRLTPGALELDCALRARGMGDVADELLLALLEPAIVGVQITGTPSVDPPILYQQQPIDHPYAKGKAVNLGVTTLASAATSTVDLVVAGYQSALLLARIGNGTTPATALGDLGLTVKGYEDDGTTLFPGGVAGGAALVATSTPVAAALTSPAAYIAQTFDLKGFDKVNLNLKNNNVAALQGATLIYYLFK